jgi:hypothetical protein
MTPEISQKLQTMLAMDLVDAQQNMICKNQSGGYDVFGRWSVDSRDGLTQVSKHGTVIATFGNTRSAVSWCIAQKYHQHNLAQEIQRLDADLQRLETNDAVARWLSQRIRDPWRKSVMQIKSQESHLRHQLVSKRMERCVSRAKYLQIRGFNDEIARTRRPAPHRTSRDGVRKPSRKTH